jgi:hypothetical protein
MMLSCPRLYDMGRGSYNYHLMVSEIGLGEVIIIIVMVEI